MELHVGLIGLGNRGYWLLRDVIVPMPDVRVTAVCDVYPDRCEKAAESVKEMGGYIPAMETDYKALIGQADVDTVIVASAWENHVEAAICAMKAGKAVAVEVGGAYTVKQCWDLVETYESTQTPFMFLENCCYGRREMMALNMAQLGLLGEIVHCKGGYLHDLRDEVSTGGECRHYRLRNCLQRLAGNYPPRELGPRPRRRT
ncbi:MAG: Gfo/Idh/MocA family oxidoreductase, partial [Lachnospiraceae bacterium]|nr:Gfo/Idh/MocA family oxidoreductase [Lachnospiraceae bacterium]